MTETAAAVPLDRDLACKQCGYNLRTLLPTGRCPECGTAITDSIAALSLATLPRDLLLAYRRGLRWLALLWLGMPLLAIMLVIASALVRRDMTLDPAVSEAVVWVAVALGEFVAPLMLLLATLALTTPMLSASGETQHPPAARILRYLPLAVTIIGGLRVLDAMGSLGRLGFVPTLADESMLPWASTLAQYGTIAIIALPLAAIIARIARQASMASLGTQAHVVAGLMMTDALLTLGARMLASLAEGLLTPALAICILVVWGILALLWRIWGVVLVYRLIRQINRALRRAENAPLPPYAPVPIRRILSHIGALARYAGPPRE